MGESVLISSYRIELRKLIRRKDTWLLFSILFIPFLYTIGMAAGSSVIQYSGEGNIGALEFVGNMFSMAHSTFIFYVIAAIVTMRSFANEIEDKSILLYIPRLRKRSSIYLSKLLSVITILLAVAGVFTAVTIALYYIFLCRRADIAGGDFIKRSSLAIDLFSIFSVLFQFIFSVCFTACLSMFIKGISSVIVYIISLVGFNLISEYKIIQFISPCFYLNQLLDSVSVFLPSTIFLLNCLYMIVVPLLIFLIGTGKFDKKDL